MENGNLIQFTPQAVSRAKELLARNGTPDHGLRVGVRGGGCSGLSYFIDVEGEENGGDRVLEFDGLKVYVDLKSQLFLGGTEIDWSDSLMERGFSFKNPNASRSCSCGESFTV
jgi:iron-sulfur cluster assembly protein